MSERDSLAELAAAGAARVGGARRVGTLNYHAAGRPKGTTARVLLHVLGWLYVVIGVGTLGFSVYLTATLPTSSASPLHQLLVTLIVILFASAALYLVTGIVYVVCAFTLGRVSAILTYVLSVVMILLFLGDACWKLVRFARSGDPDGLGSALGGVAVCVVGVALMIWMMIALASARGQRAVRRR